MRLRLGTIALAALTLVACSQKEAEPPRPKPARSELGGAIDASKTKIAEALGDPQKKELPAIFRVVPDQALFVVALTDLDTFREDFKKTNLWAIWEDPLLKPWRDRVWPKLEEAVESGDGPSLARIGELFHGDILLFGVPRTHFDEGTSEPIACGVLRTTTNKPSVMEFINQYMRNEDDILTKWVDDIVVFADDRDLLDRTVAVLEADDSATTRSEAYEAFRAIHEPADTFHVWVDIARLSKDADASAAGALEAVGVANLSRIYYSAGIEGEGTMSNLRLQFDGERKGLFSLAGENGPSKAMGLVSPDTKNFVSIRHAGPAKILETVQSILAAVSPDTAQRGWRSFILSAGEGLGIDIEKDLPALLGNEIAIASRGAIPLNFYAAALVESPAPARLVNLIDTTIGKYNIQPKAVEYGGVTYKYFMPVQTGVGFQISYGAVGDFVVVGLQQYGVREAIDALKSGESLAAIAEVKKAGQLAGPPGWFEYIEFPKPAADSVLLSATRLMSQSNLRVGLELDPADIPDFQAALNHQGVAVTRVRAFADGMEMRGYAGGLGFPGSPAAGGVVAAIAIPGYMRAREVSRATSCQENLIKIEGAVDQWAVEHNKVDGETVTMSELIGPTKYLKRTPRCRGGGKYPTEFTVGKTPTCDYVTPSWFDTQGDKYRHRVPDVSP